MKKMQGIMKERICKRCGKIFIPAIWNHIYCGSKSGKTGCSYKVHLKRIQLFNQTRNKEWMNNYQKEWRKKQRRLNTDYAHRQRELKKRYCKTDRSKILSKLSRARNIKTILKLNRKRMLLKKGVVGTHTEDEWQSLKGKNNFCCVICQVSENELKINWVGTGFVQLTRDHIVPISRGGTDSINNIQPLCISCNARKKDGTI